MPAHIASYLEGMPCQVGGILCSLLARVEVNINYDGGFCEMATCPLPAGLRATGFVSGKGYETSIMPLVPYDR